jgi:hypothetical protein
MAHLEAVACEVRGQFRRGLVFLILDLGILIEPSRDLPEIGLDLVEYCFGSFFAS